VIYSVHHYVNDEGLKVFQKQLALMQDDGNFGKVKYSGACNINIPIGLNQTQETPIEFDFPEGYDLEECFEKFQKVVDATCKRVMQELDDEEKERIAQARRQLGG
jgi:hypothetical protein